MFRWLLAFTVGISLVGCESGAPATASGDASKPAAETTVFPAGPVQRSRIGLFNELPRPNNPGDPSERSSTIQVQVNVGDSPEQALKVFPTPKSAYLFSDLPPSLSKNYEAKGWETAGGEGYGVILYGGNVVAAMYQVNGQPESMLEQLRSLQEQGMGTAQYKIDKRPVQFWFWHDGSQTLMLSSYDKGEGRLNITLAMGDNNVLDAIGVSEKKADLDANRLARPAPSLGARPQG